MTFKINKYLKTIISFALLVSIIALSIPPKVNASGGVTENGKYYIVSALNSNMAIDIRNGSYDSRANVQLYKRNNTQAQLFQLTYKNGYYTIKNVKSNKVLDVSGGCRASGVNVWQYDSNSTDAQKWQISSTRDGWFTIKSKLGYYLDVSGGRSTNGTNIQVYTGNGTKSQKFKFIPYVKYTYETVTIKFNTVDEWIKNTAMAERRVVGISSNYMARADYTVALNPKIIVEKTVLEYKTISCQVPTQGPNARSVTQTFKLPYKIKYKLHSHETTTSVYFMCDHLQLVQRCTCGFRCEGSWEIPWWDKNGGIQNTQDVLNALPKINK